MQKYIFFTVIYSFLLYLGQELPSAVTHLSAQQWCPDPLLFGPLCAEYMCHCGKYYCNRNTGRCQYDLECEAGWMGSGCQYVNLAYGAEHESNHLQSTNFIVDGLNRTCASKMDSYKYDIAYATIDFGREVKIKEVHLLFSKSGPPPPFNVSIHSINGHNMCASINDTRNRKQFIVKCNVPLYGQYLNITSNVPDAKLELCELQVPAGRNLAYGKPASQSSIVGTGNANQAVDRDTSVSRGQTCTETTQSTDPWWLLDFQAPVKIQWFRIYGREENVHNYQWNQKLVNFRISLSLDNVTFTEYYRDNSTYIPPVIRPGLKPDVQARFVKIDLQGDNRILALCEVQVFGDCIDGRFGDCSKTCDNCLGQICNKVTGYCSECRPGTYGNKCGKSCNYCKNGDCQKVDGVCHSCPLGKQGKLCENNCSDYRYGENCTKSCGKCHDRDPCDKVTGHCPRGCQIGWQGEQCQQECEDNYYGNCSTPCGHCAERKPCNKTSGQCDNSICAQGWQTENCDKTCDDHFYGDCKIQCGHCRDFALCNKIDGSCPLGLCSEGWAGGRCDTMCKSTLFGQNCAYQCGYCLNGTCDRITGSCDENAGCQPGWQGSRCDTISAGNQLLEKSPIDDGIIGGYVGVTVAVVIIISVVILIIVKRRRKIGSPKSNIPSQRTNEDGLIYENSTFFDISTGTPSTHEVRNEVYENKRMTIPKQEKTEANLTKEDSKTYYSIGHALPKGTISLSRFWDYVQNKCLDENYFPEEFEKLPSGPQLPTTVALRPENKNKNRYKQLYAYDVNRVVLKPLGDDENDYINASFIDGYSRQKMYIASQGTTKDNINDFWRMLWQFDVEKIVMLTGLVEAGRHKCELYWPEDEQQTLMFGCVAVRLLDTDSFADYEIRTLQMFVGNESKQLTQLHYTTWPDNGVPKDASSIVQFWNRVNRVPTKRPIVVHCSAGIGRTGTYIALDYLVNQGKAEGHVNVSACISNLRRQRVNLVQTKEQYIFLHEILVEALMLSGTATSSENFPKMNHKLLEVDSESGKLKLQLEYERLHNEATTKMEDEEDTVVNSTKDKFSAAKKPENRVKNRHDNILPADRHRALLRTPVSDRNDYINAVVLPSHRQREGFILTQMPLADTVIDFWRMINDFEIGTIVMFNSESSKTHDIGIYWPTEGKLRDGPLSVILTKEEKHTNYIERTLCFSLTVDENSRTVRQFQFTNWVENADVPGSPESLLQLLDAVESWQKSMDAKPVVVHCLNGAERSGLYCVISTVIEGLKVDRDVAIAQTIKRMRSFRHQIIPNYEQFRFCHECILQYMKTFETPTSKMTHGYCPA